MQKIYKLNLSEQFKKEFRKLDKHTQKIIRAWIIKNLEDCENPRWQGKSLKGNKIGLWRYRIGDYRLVVEIHDKELVILALSVGHRREVYR